jgi:hypothetical protein
MTEEDTKKTVIRASGLPSYADCSRRAATRFLGTEIADAGYLLRNDVGANIGAALGSSTHEAASYSLNSKMYDSNLGTDNDALELAMNKLHDIGKDGISYDDTTPTYDRAELQLRVLVSSYRTLLGPIIEPVEVEVRLEANIGEGFIFSGQFDVRELTTIRDLKTGAVARANIAQYGGYALLCRVHNRTVEKIVEDYLPRQRIPEPEFYEYGVNDAMLAASAILKRIKADVANFRTTGEPTSFIANPQSMLCSDKFCPAWGTKFCCEHKTKGEEKN